MYKAKLDGVGTCIVVASTFNCRILGFRVLFPVLQHILIVALFHIHKQAAWKKLQKKRKSSSSVSVPIKLSLRRCHNCGSHRVVIIVVSMKMSLRLGHQWFAKRAKVFLQRNLVAVKKNPILVQLSRKYKSQSVKVKRRIFS